MKTKQVVKATAKGRRFTIEVPPVEKWIVKFEDLRAARLKSGELLVIDGFTNCEETGWTARVWKDFHAILKSGEYYGEFLRALAHAVGVERMRWEGIWLEMDDYLRDVPDTPEDLRAHWQRRAGQLEAAGRMEQAKAFRERLGISETVQ